MISNISILPFKHIREDDIIQLVDILNYDSLLRSALGSKSDFKAEDFRRETIEWSKKNNADIFAIILNNSSIGMISLSHQDLNQNTARIGYWICSKYWGEGRTSIAFKQLLQVARNKRIDIVSASIKVDNLASRRIWEKNGANIKLKDSKYVVELRL